MDEDAGLRPELAALRRTAREFAGREVRPRVAGMEARERVDDDLVARMGEIGFFGTPYPPEWGGAGLGQLGFAIVLEEISRAHASTALVIAASSGLAASLLHRYGSDEQRERWLRPLAAGAIVGAFCLTEPEAGSDVAALRATARPDGGGWVIDGEKAYVTNGDRAGVLLVFARTGEAGARGGISLFAVERGAPGLAVARLEDKMGLRASDTAHLAFGGARAPRSALVGGAGEGFAIALSVLNRSRVGIAAMCLGIAKEAIALGWRHAHGRELFGRTIGEFQVTQHAFAEMQIEASAAEALVHRTAAQIDAGGDAAGEASVCKAFASEAAQRAVDRALQLHGGAGYLRGADIERLYRDIRVARIYEGANELQRNNIYRVMRRQRG